MVNWFLYNSNIPKGNKLCKIESMSQYLTDSDFHVLEQFNRALNDAKRNKIPLVTVREIYCSMYSFSPLLCAAFRDDTCHVRLLAKKLTKCGYIVV